jgi:hypothetical protein
MMNQEIKLDGGDDVMGEIIPKKIYGPDLAQNGTDNDKLLWSNLDGYYRMSLLCGYLTPSKGSLNGRLRNIYSPQQETAPLPYKSANNGRVIIIRGHNLLFGTLQIAPYLELRLTGILSRYQTISTLETKTLPY